MIKTLHTTTRNFLSIRLLACFAVLCLSFVGASSAFAATYVSPDAITVNCLEESAGITSVGSDEVEYYGSTTNACGVTVDNARQNMIMTNGCEGLATTSSEATNTFTIPAGDYDGADYIGREGCVYCDYTDNILTGHSYPNFTVVLTVSAIGGYKLGSQTIIAADTGAVTASYLIHNTGLYAPNCPIVE